MKEIAVAESKYPELLKEFLETKKEVAPVKSKQELEKEQQSKDLLEYYGYEIAPDDPRFPILLEKMTEAKKKVSTSMFIIQMRLGCICLYPVMYLLEVLFCHLHTRVSVLRTFDESPSTQVWL